MLPEHSLTAQMSCQPSPAPSSAEAQQPSEPAASAESVQAVDDMLPEHSLTAQMSCEAPAPTPVAAPAPAPLASHQIDPFAQAQTSFEASDMLPEHSLAAQMSVDEPQADVSMEDEVTNKTKQLRHVQPHTLSTIESGKHTHWHFLVGLAVQYAFHHMQVCLLLKLPIMSAHHTLRHRKAGRPCAPQCCLPHANCLCCILLCIVVSSGCSAFHAMCP